MIWAFSGSWALHRPGISPDCPGAGQNPAQALNQDWYTRLNMSIEKWSYQVSGE